MEQEQPVYAKAKEKYGAEKMPVVVLTASPDPAAESKSMALGATAFYVKPTDLDGLGKMQCTSCHDPHSDRYYQPGRVPHFWVKPTVAEVCLTCHEPR